MRHSVPDPILSRPHRPETGDAPTELVDLRGTVRRIWAGRLTIFAMIVLTVSCAVIFLSQMRPEYTATAKMIFGTPQPTVVELQQVIATPNIGKDALQNEIEVLRSTAVIERVIATENLAENPEFNAQLQDTAAPSRWTTIRNTLRDFLLAFEIEETARAPVPPSGRQAELALIQHLRRNLDLTPVPGSQVIDIAYTATSPTLAAQVANAVSQGYIDDQIDSRRAAARSATDWLSERVEELRARVQTAEEKVEEIRGALSLEAGQSLEVSRLQLGALAAALTQEQSLQARLEGESERAEQALATVADLSTVPAFLASESFRAVQSRINTLDHRMNGQNNGVAPDHAVRTRIESEMRNLRDDLREEAQKVIASMMLEAGTTANTVKSLTQSLADMEARIATHARNEVILREAERDAEAGRVLYENFLTRLKETSVQEELQAPDARILSPAEVPLGPNAARRALIVALAALVGCIAGICVVLLRDAWSNRFRTPQELEEFAGFPVLSALPSLGKRALRHAVVDTMIRDPRSSFAEAIRNLRTSVQFSTGGPPPKVVLFTSSVPREGKTSTAALLGKASQKMGRPTIIIDCDLRVPALSGLVRRAGERPGLVAVIEGKCDWRTAIHTDPTTGLHVLTARRGEMSRETNAADILSGPGFRKLLTELSGLYEMVILDTPPTLAVTDARILSNYANAVIYAVRWNKTTRGAVEQGLKELRSVQAPVAGLVMTMMDPAKAEQYAYDGYRYDKTRYGAYYAP